MWKNAKVLVAGGSGFIGSNLIQRLLALKCHVRATLHDTPAILKDERIEYIQADLVKIEDCQKAIDGMDYVFMCAANTSGAAVMTQTPLAHVTPNVLMNTLLLEAAYQAKIKKFLFISSSAAYPPSDDHPVKEDEMFLGDPPDIYYSVGWMKRYAEILCKIYAQKIKQPMPVIVIRPSNMYGPYDKYDFGKSHVTAALIRKVIERHNPLEVWGTGDDVRDLLYIEDFIDALILAMEKIETYDAINIAFGKGYSVKDVLYMLLKIDGYSDAKVVFNPLKPSTIPIRLVDTQRARNVLGFESKTDLMKGLEQTIHWYRSLSK